MLTPEIEELFKTAKSKDESLIREIRGWVLPSETGLSHSAISVRDIARPTPSVRTIKVTPTTAEILFRIEAGVTYHLAPGIYHIDRPIVMANSSRLIGSRSGRTHVVSSVKSSAVAVENVSDVEVSQLRITSTDATAIHIQESKEVGINKVIIENVGRYAIHIDNNCEGIFIKSNHIVKTGYGGIIVRGDVRYAKIDSNVLEDIYEKELEIGNYAAAIRVQALEHARPEYDDGVTIKIKPPASTDLISNGIFSHYIGPDRPRHVEISNNRILRCRSQGIYLSGALLTAVEHNSIINCDKEGLCVDHQSLYCTVENNFFTGCGGRLAQTANELKFDHLSDEDIGSPKGVTAKLPAISIDYSDDNLITENRIIGNFGCGIKMVRSAMFNTVSRNFLANNNRGDNERHSFSEIHIGNSSSEGTSKGRRRKIFDNRNFGSSFNLLESNELIAAKRGIRIRPSSQGCVMVGNTVFGARNFDYFIENGDCFTLNKSRKLAPLPQAKWPPYKDSRIR